MKLAVAPLTLAVALIFGSCAKEYGTEIEQSDKNVEALKASDKELWAEIERQSAELQQKLDHDLQESEQKKREQIMARMNAIRGSIDSKIAEINVIANDSIAKKETQLDAMLTRVDANLDGFRSHMTQSLAQLETDINKAKDEGDAETLARLTAMKTKCNKLEQSLNNVKTQKTAWEAVIKRYEGVDYTSTFNDLDTRLKALESFDINVTYDNMQKFLKAFQKAKFEELTHDQVVELNASMTKIKSLYEEYVDGIDDAESDMADLEDRVTEALDAMQDAYSQLESVSGTWEGIDDLVSQGEDMLADVETMFDEIDDYIIEMDAAINDFVNIPDQIIEAASRIDSAIEEVKALCELSDYADYIMEIDGVAYDIADRMNEIAAKMPWIFEGETFTNPL